MNERRPCACYYYIILLFNFPQKSLSQSDILSYSYPLAKYPSIYKLGKIHIHIYSRDIYSRDMHIYSVGLILQCSQSSSFLFIKSLLCVAKKW